MEEKQCIWQGNRLDVELGVSSINGKLPSTEIKSREYVINGLVVFQVKIKIFRTFGQKNSFKYNASVNITLRKTLKTDVLTYVIKCSCEQFGIIKPITLCPDDTTWRQLYEYKSENWTSTFTSKFKLTLELNLKSSSSGPLGSLINDTDLSNFELRAKDGSVHVHKDILTRYSPFLRAKINGEWRNAKEITVNGLTKETLQHFKDYMYNDKLPDKGLEQLIGLASHYMMEDLVQKCSFKLLTKLAAQNAVAFVELSLKLKTRHFFFALMENIQCGYIQVKDMEELQQQATTQQQQAEKCGPIPNKKSKGASTSSE